VLQARKRAPTPSPFVVFTFGVHQGVWGCVTIEPNPNFSNDDTTNYNNAIDDDQWGEDGINTQ
jgi:hypothetical protein